MRDIDPNIADEIDAVVDAAMPSEQRIYAESYDVTEDGRIVYVELSNGRGIVYPFGMPAQPHGVAVWDNFDGEGTPAKSGWAHRQKASQRFADAVLEILLSIKWRVREWWHGNK